MPFNVRRPSSKFSRPTGSRPPAHAGGLLPSTVGSCGVLCERTPRFVPDDLRAPALWCSHAGACWRQQVSFVETADGRAGVDTPSATSSPATACVRCSERADDASLSRRCHRDAGSRSISSRSPRRRMRRTRCRPPRVTGTEIICDCPGSNTDENRTIACLSLSPLCPVNMSTVVTTCQAWRSFTQ